MAAVETALVSANGRLLIELDDGTIIDAGYVRGGQGPAGKDGADGAPGIPGAKGDPGVNGAQWHTGVGAPEIGLGANGDLYLDVASALLPIFQKVNGDWLFLCNLKVPPSGGGGGQAGAAGGGGSIIIYPQPDGGPQPDKDNDGKPIDKGDIWFDPNTGLLWVYNGTVWLPVGDRPPVSIGANPPIWNSSGDTNNRYPIREGDLWFDSDQLALYVAANDSNDNLVWVITIPADRSVLLAEVPVNPFVFPSPAPGTYANDGDTVYNPTTELWYIYNGSKNQWIDLPPGRQELSLQAILLRGADNFPTTFEYEPADRVTYDTDALCYVNADDHPSFTRIVVPFVDTAGFDWTVMLRSIRKGDQLSLVQIDAVDPLDPDDNFPFRSDYLTISDITENAESINIDIDYQQENPIHLPLFGEPVAIRFKAIVNVGDREIYYQDTAPDSTTNPDLVEGNLWVDTDDNKMYVWNGSAWSEVTACTSGGGGDFVEKAGDTMTGDLTMDDADILIDNGDLEIEAKGNTAYIQNVNNRFGKIVSRAPKDTEVGSTDFSSEFGIKVDLNEGSTNKNRLKIGNSTGDIVTISSGGGPQIILGGNEFTGAPGQSGLTGGVPILGIPTPDFENSPGDLAVNKEYVDTRDDVLSNQIIELEEEIDALAPTVERGIWAFNLGGLASSRGQMSMYDDDYTNVGNPIGIFKQAKSIWLNEEDNAGTPHGFSNVKVGNLLELFVEGDPDYGLFEVVDVHDETNGASSWWVIEVNFVRALSDTSLASNGDNIRLKIFEAPSGGDAGDFVKRTGDTMTGDLTIEYPKKLKVKNLVSHPGENLVIAYEDTWRISVGDVNVNFSADVQCLRRADNGGKTFNIRGNNSAGNLVDLFYAYRDANGDGVAYYGIQEDRTNAAHVATTGHVARKVNKAIKAAGLQLGLFVYKTNQHPFEAGSIKSNTALSGPANITQLDIWESNVDSIDFGIDFYETYIEPKMYLRFMGDGYDAAYYTGRINSVERISNGIRLKLTPIPELCDGNTSNLLFYEVAVGYNRFGFKYPE